jgi:hypothetical protein
MMGMKSQNAKCPCRYCDVEGFSKKSGNSTMYYPLHFPHGRSLKSGNGVPARSVMNYDIADIMDPTSPLGRTSEKMLATFSQINDMEINPNTSAAELELLKKSTGINGQTILTKLPTMIPPDCFPLDVMHLIILNVFRRMFTHWNRTFFKTENNLNNSSKQGYELSDATWAAIGKQTERNRSSLPLSFGSPSRDIFKYWRGFKAEEWRNWMLRLSIPLLIGNLPDKFLKPWSNFIAAVKILLDVSPKTKEELDNVEKNIKSFYEHYERYFIINFS